jgi:DNA-binding transcriptional ArsR family regulator
METQSHTLLKYLLQSVEASHYRIAEALDVSPASLSRHASGLLSKPSTLKRATTFFNNLLPDDAMVDADLLVGTPITARDLVRLARALRVEGAKGSK